MSVIVKLFVCFSVLSFICKVESTPRNHRVLKENTHVHILLYETDDKVLSDEESILFAFQERAQAAGIKSTVFGQGSQFEGFGSKYEHVRPLLQQMDPDVLVVVADGRDVVLNVPSKTKAIAAVSGFQKAYHKLIQDNPDAVVVSAEAQCCVSALSHAEPGDYFDAVTGTRKNRACRSGEGDCTWEDNDETLMWDDFMVNLADRRAGRIDNPYLNAGLLAGYPENLLRLIDRMDLLPQEDDQAVLTGLMHHDPTSIVLDYGEELFGNNIWSDGFEDGCIFEADEDKVLFQKVTEMRPLIVHASGMFYDCLYHLLAQTSPESNAALSRRNMAAESKESPKLDGDQINRKMTRGKGKGRMPPNYGRGKGRRGKGKGYSDDWRSQGKSKGGMPPNYGGKGKGGKSRNMAAESKESPKLDGDQINRKMTRGKGKGGMPPNYGGKGKGGKSKGKGGGKGRRGKGKGYSDDWRTRGKGKGGTPPNYGGKGKGGKSKGKGGGKGKGGKGKGYSDDWKHRGKGKGRRNMAAESKESPKLDGDQINRKMTRGKGKGGMPPNYGRSKGRRGKGKGYSDDWRSRGKGKGGMPPNYGGKGKGGKGKGY